MLPAGRKARVRSLRANNGAASRATAGQRCALALHGVSRGDVARGDVITDTAPAPVSKHLDIEVTWLGKPLARPGTVSVHLGTAMLQARISPVARFARLAFPHGVSAWHGDRLLLRDPGTSRLIGAGVVVDPLPPGRGVARRERIAGLGADATLEALLADGMVDMEWFAKAFHLPPADAPGLVSFTVRGVRHAMRRERWDAQCDALERAVAGWHAAHPESIGPRPAEVGTPLAAMIDALVDAGRVVREGPSLRLPQHRPVLSAGDEALWQEFAPLLEGEGDKPPRVHELAARLAMEPKAVADFLQRAARAGRVHRVAPNRFFLPRTVDRLVDLAVSLDTESEHHGFAAADYRDRSGLGRNLTIEVLEYLDQAGYTRRAGNLRRARRSFHGRETSPVGRPDFKSGERRLTSLVGSTPASSANSQQRTDMQKTYATLALKREGEHVLVVTLNRPEVLNAISTQMGRDWLELFNGLAADPGEVRCIVLTGAGDRAFCAGADLKERDGMSVETWRTQHAQFEQAFVALMECPVPMLAAVNGHAYGGGLETALCCDFIYAPQAQSSRSPSCASASCRAVPARRTCRARWASGAPRS